MTLGNLFVDNIANAAIGLLENDVHQLSGIGFGHLLANKLGGVFGQAADGSDFAAGPAGGSTALSMYRTCRYFLISATYQACPFATLRKRANRAYTVGLDLNQLTSISSMSALAKALRCRTALTAWRSFSISPP